MVFVTEPMRLTSHIEPDTDLPPSQKIEVLKLNDLRKFPTGIYDYSVMTSVFASVEVRKTIPLFGAMKVALLCRDLHPKRKPLRPYGNGAVDPPGQGVVEDPP